LPASVADRSGGGRYTAAAAAFKLNVAERRSAKPVFLAHA